MPGLIFLLIIVVGGSGMTYLMIRNLLEGTR